MTTATFHKRSLLGAFIAGSLLGGPGLATLAQADNAAPPEAHSDGIGATITDTAITAKVKSRFVGDDRLKHADISVATTNGIVTLTGTAASSDAKEVAETLTRSVDGVKSVDDELRLTPSTSTEAKVDQAATSTKRVASDSWITTKVKSEILADSVSKGFEVNVTTTHGVVVLKGSLATQDGVDHVKDIAAKVKGVKSVDVSMLKAASS